MTKAVPPPLREAFDGQADGEERCRSGTQHRLSVDAARALLVCDPVGLLVLDGQVAEFGDARAEPALWRKALTSSSALVLDARVAERGYWKSVLDGAVSMRIGGSDGVQLAILDGGDEHAAVALRCALRDPDVASQMRRRLEQLTEDLAARQNARDAGATAQRLEVASAEVAVQGDAATADLLEARPETLRPKTQLQTDSVEASRPGEESSAQVGQLATAEARTVAAKRHLANLASISWRLTQPLRSMVRGRHGLAKLPRRAVKLTWWTITLQLHTRYRLKRIKRAHQALERRAETLERRATGLESLLELERGRIDQFLGRVEAVEPRATGLESLLELERGRIDWALGALEGITTQINAYHIYRETDEYQAAFAAATPLVSVCVGTMDRADLLVERSIASLRQQSYRNLQIIVVGDYCTDDTARRIAALGDDRIQFVNLPERGPYPRPGIDRWYVAGSNAMNHALSLCEGQFVTHLDDDDAMVPHRIETLVGAALQNRADFLWHPLWYENRDGTWQRIGDGRLQLGQVSTGSIFYHRYFTRIPWDVHAYQLHEPGDWNRVRKIKLLRPRLHFVDEPLLYHHVEQSQGTFVARDGERFLE